MRALHSAGIGWFLEWEGRKTAPTYLNIKRHFGFRAILPLYPKLCCLQTWTNPHSDFFPLFTLLPHSSYFIFHFFFFAWSSVGLLGEKGGARPPYLLSCLVVAYTNLLYLKFRPPSNQGGSGFAKLLRAKWALAVCRVSEMGLNQHGCWQCGRKKRAIFAKDSTYTRKARRSWS